MIINNNKYMTTIESVLFELHQLSNSYIQLLPMEILNIITNNFVLNTDSLEKIRDFLLLNDNFIIKSISGYERIKIYSTYNWTLDIIETKNSIVRIEIECESEEQFISCSIDKYLVYKKKNKYNKHYVIVQKYKNLYTNEHLFIGLCN